MPDLVSFLTWEGARGALLSQALTVSRLIPIVGDPLKSIFRKSLMKLSSSSKHRIIYLSKSHAENLSNVSKTMLYK